MTKLFWFALLLVACSGRPLDAPCRVSTDCLPEEWCVMTWWTGKREPAGVCASQCSPTGACDAGECVRIGDGTTQAWPVEPLACRE